MTSKTSDGNKGMKRTDNDDLTVIPGIGKARQEWLRKTFQVRTLLDLANLSADDIEAKLKADSQIVSRGQIESWIEHARQGGESATKIAAQFVVYFHQHRDENGLIKYQTKVHHMEADKSAEWPGIEQAQLCAWMMQELEGQVRVAPTAKAEIKTEAKTEVNRLLDTVLPAPPHTTSERFQRLLARVQGTLTASPVQAAPTPSAVSSERYQRLLAKVQAADRPTPQPGVATPEMAPVQIGKIELSMPSILQRHTPFTVEARFKLIGATAESIPCNASFYAHQRATGKVIDLGTVQGQSVQGGQVSYEAVLSNVQLDPGTYRLQVVVRAGSASGPEYGEMPFVRVL